MSVKDFIESDNIRLNQQLLFSAEIDKMTDVLRRTLLINKSRRENDAEHSWHIAAMAMLFSEYTVEPVNVSRAVQMCVVHDIVEIDAGDTFAYDVQGNAGKAEREKEAADKLFAKLPADQGEMIRSLWEEFDAAETPDARYAACMDRLQPFLHNTLTDGHTWGEGAVSRAAVEKRMSVIKEFMPEVYKWIAANIDSAVNKGWLASTVNRQKAMIETVIPTLEEMWFRESLLADEETMSYNHAWGGTVSFPKENWADWYDRWIVDHDDKRYYRYIKDEQGFVGEIAYHYDSEYDGYVADVIVLAKYRGKGYGAQGLKLLCEAAKENGIPVLYDDIAIDNTAIKLFLEQGFHEEYRTKEKIVLKKELK